MFSMTWDLFAGRTHRWEIGPLLQEYVHCLDYGPDVPFGAHPTNTGLSGRLSQLVGQMNCDHEDGDLRKKLRDPPGDLDSVEVRHLEVQQNHIRRIFLNPLQRFGSCWHLVANMPSALLFEKRPKITSHSRVVISHKNSHQTKPFFHSC
jgi:hypothetical protein